MKLSNPNESLSIRVLSAFILLTAALPTIGQPASPDTQQPRGQRPDGQNSAADVRVWVGVDVLPDGLTEPGDATNLPARPAQNQNSRFAGVWGTEAMPGLVLTLQLDGDFSLVTTVDLERRCSAGVERGRWIASPDTNELLFRIQTDTNGRCGLSDLESPMAVIKTESGLALVNSDPAAGERQISLIRVDP